MRSWEQGRFGTPVLRDTLLDNGGTITHHHSVGVDHAPYMRDEIGDLGIAVLRAAKRELDPAGIMNPGKLLKA